MTFSSLPTVSYIQSADTSTISSGPSTPCISAPNVTRIQTIQNISALTLQTTSNKQCIPSISIQNVSALSTSSTPSVPQVPKGINDITPRHIQTQSNEVSRRKAVQKRNEHVDRDSSQHTVNRISECICDDDCYEKEVTRVDRGESVSCSQSV